MEQKSKHAMIDIETLGVKSDAVVLSVGAVKFTEFSLGEQFYIELNLDEEISTDATMSAETLVWWLERRKKFEVSMLNTTGDEQELPNRQKLQQLLDFVDDCEYFWSKGTNFDFPILENCLSRYALEPTWKYYKLRDFRTLQALYKSDRIVPLNTHSALSDAINQAKEAVAIFGDIRRNERIDCV